MLYDFMNLCVHSADPAVGNHPEHLEMTKMTFSLKLEVNRKKCKKQIFSMFCSVMHDF